MASSVEICNIALSRLGADRITSLTDNTQNAKICNAIYNHAVRSVINMGSWSSAIRLSNLAKTTATPTYGYTSEFQLPTNPKALKIISINEDRPGDYPFEIRGDKIYSDLTTMQIKYLAELSDSESFGQDLQDAIIANIEWQISYSVTGSLNVESARERKFLETLERSLSNNGTQGSAQTLYAESFIDVRY